MRRPSCGFVNPKGMKFCGQCEATLGPHCPQCGFENPSGFAFWGQCGAALTGQTPASVPTPLAPRAQAPRRYTPAHFAEKILTSRSALEGERRQVTLMFADLKSSMELLADRDPEDARAILAPILERMMDAVHRYKGTVNQVMGDRLMALLGAPIPDEAYAVQAYHGTVQR